MSHVDSVTSLKAQACQADYELVHFYSKEQRVLGMAKLLKTVESLLFPEPRVGDSDGGSIQAWNYLLQQ